MARPSKYSIALTDRICARIAAGESLVKICRDDPKMPHRATVMSWLLTHDEFHDKYARARELQAEVLADEVVDIADDGQNDTYRDENGNVRTDYDVVARSKLRVDARKWAASKLAPKKYGEKIHQEITGKDGGPITTKAERDLTDEELAAELAKHGLQP